MSRSISKTCHLARQCEIGHLRRCARTSPCFGVHDNLQPLPFSHSTPSRSHVVRLSTSARCRAEAASNTAKSGKQTPAEAKMAKMAQQAQRSGLTVDDVGLLPDTFVMPRSKNLPSWISNFRGRLLLQRQRIKQIYQDAGMALWYKWSVRPRPKLHRRQIPRAAEDLHKAMYEHFAAGNLEPIQSSLVSGMMGSLRARIAQRAPGTQLKWTLHRYLSKSKLMTLRPYAIPVKGQKKTQRMGLVQAVVRIHSLQSLQSVRKTSSKDKDRRSGQNASAQSSEPVSQEHAKELVEYIVVQKSLKNSREGPWRLWGTTEETTLERLQQAERKQKEGDRERRREQRGTSAAATA